MQTQEGAMKVVNCAMMIAPFAVFGQITEKTSKIEFDAILGMYTFVGTVVLGLICLLSVYLILIDVDRILDMCRIVVNVSGDITAYLILDKIIPET